VCGDDDDDDDGGVAGGERVGEQRIDAPLALVGLGGFFNNCLGCGAAGLGGFSSLEAGVGDVFNKGDVGVGYECSSDDCDDDTAGREGDTNKDWFRSWCWVWSLLLICCCLFVSAT
jgi:hypothetical protein